jgi:ribosomal protein L40E
MSSNAKTVKKGDFIVKEGDKISSLIVLQSGSSTLCMVRQKKNIDLFAVGPSQIIGEQIFAGTQTHSFSLMANSEVQYVEVPVDAAKAQLESAPQFLKVLTKSLVDRLKSSLNDVKSARLEKDSSPCPEDQTAKIFGAIFHAANHKAKSEDKSTPHILVMDWVQLKQYCQRIFGESPRRIEQACNVLVKLKIASYQMGKPIDDPEGADEIQKITFHDLTAVEAFFEFYQYYYFKGGAGLIIKYDESAFQLLSHFLKMIEKLPLDRHGVVAIDYPKVVEHFKNELSINLNKDHFTQLENRGIFAKRQAKTDGSVSLSFEVKEWKTMQKIWKMLREIDKWNEKGFVSTVEDEVTNKKKSDGLTCSACNAEVPAAAKFCQECGAKLESAGKAA